MRLPSDIGTEMLDYVFRNCYRTDHLADVLLTSPMTGVPAPMRLWSCSQMNPFAGSLYNKLGPRDLLEGASYRCRADG